MGMRLNGKRRNRDASFQWLIIGIVLGMGCAFSFGLALYVFEFIEITTDNPATEEPPQVVVITPTDNPDSPANTPEPDDSANSDTTAVDDTSDESNQVQDATPTNLPDTNSTTETDTATDLEPSSTPLPGGSGPTNTPTIGFSADFNGENNNNDVTTPSASDQNNGGAASVPDTLLISRSPLLPVDGGVFKMGTTDIEAQNAVAQCVSRDGGACESWMVTDSIPPHDISLDPFQIEKYEVTVAQYVAFLNSLVAQNPSTSPHTNACNGQPCILTVNEEPNSDIVFDGQLYAVRDAVVDRSNYPMTFVFWEGAKAYCAAIGRYLPTEAQWERAARGPTNLIYPWGPVWDSARANTKSAGSAGTVEVTTYEAEGVSGFGVVNMAGNVAEWTGDYYSENIYQTRNNSGQTFSNPEGAPFSDKVVVRGGAWDVQPFFARSVHRQDRSPGDANPSTGFRCAADVGAN